MMANTTQHFHENLIQKQDRCKADSFWSGPTKQCHIRWRRVMEWIIKHFQALFSRSSTLLHRSSPHRLFKPSYLVCPVLTKSKRVYKPILRSHNGCLWRHIQLKCSHSESIKSKWIDCWECCHCSPSLWASGGTQSAVHAAWPMTERPSFNLHWYPRWAAAKMQDQVHTWRTLGAS